MVFMIAPFLLTGNFKSAGRFEPRIFPGHRENEGSAVKVIRFLFCG